MAGCIGAVGNDHQKASALPFHLPRRHALHPAAVLVDSRSAVTEWTGIDAG